MKSPLKSKKPWQKMHFSCFLWGYFHGGIRFGTGFLVRRVRHLRRGRCFFGKTGHVFGKARALFFGKTWRDMSRCKSAGYEVRFFSARRLSFFAFFVAICYNAVVAGLCRFAAGPRFRILRIGKGEDFIYFLLCGSRQSKTCTLRFPFSGNDYLRTGHAYLSN